MIPPNVLLWLGLLLCLKHFVIDGPLQTPYQYLNKGKFLHPGGLLHASMHGIATSIIFVPLGLWWLGVIDLIVHYVVDWSKVNLTQKFKWSQMQVEHWDSCEHSNKRIPAGLLITSNWYFYALIADQCLHFATYLGLLYLAATL